jgi:hypothetical protein
VTYSRSHSFLTTAAAAVLIAGLAGGVAAAQTQAAGSVESLPVAPHAASAKKAPAAPATPAPAAVPASQGPVTVRNTVDRTAMWVADRVTYTIAITCTKGVDILVDDLGRDKLKVDGFDIIGGDTVRHADGDEVTHYEFRYVLTTYRTDVPTLTIAPLTVRYYIKRGGQRPDDAAPAGSVTVPGAAVAFRSLLPDDQVAYPIRDGWPAAVRPLAFRILQPLGIGLILLSFAPVVLVAIAFARWLQQRRAAAGTGPSPRQARQAARASLDAVRGTDPTTAEARREAFTQLDALVRQHVSDVSGIRAPSLTPAEIAAELQPRASRMPVELVTSVLTTCELARYAAPDLLPPADAWRETLAQAEQVLATGR